MITIKNEHLTATFSKLGAEMKSLQLDGKDYLWYGDEKFWGRTAPVLFPICSNLKNKQYIYNGKAYGMPSHGFARDSVFELESHADNSATFLLSSQNCPQENYPFEYELRITYTLDDRKLSVRYDVKNIGENDMYFSIGAHEGYRCDGGIEQYEIIFSEKENLNAYQLEGNILSHRTELIAENCDVLPLKYDYFSVDAIILKDHKSRSLTLRNTVTDQKIKVDFKGFPYLLIWTVPNAPFICIEPWCGITDPVDTSGNICEKEGIIKLESGKTFTRTHSIEII